MRGYAKAIPLNPRRSTLQKQKNVFAINSTFFIFSFHVSIFIHRLLRHSQPIHRSSECRRHSDSLEKQASDHKWSEPFAATAAHFVSKINLPTSFLLATENRKVFHSTQICLDCFSPVALSKASPQFLLRKIFTNGLPFSKLFVMYERKHQKGGIVNG